MRESKKGSKNKGNVGKRTVEMHIAINREREREKERVDG